jgi:hypothetical protein
MTNYPKGYRLVPIVSCPTCLHCVYDTAYDTHQCIYDQYFETDVFHICDKYELIGSRP